MADSKIRELETGSLSDNNDYFVVATNSGDTVKIPYSALATFLFGTSLIEGSNIDITDATEQDGIKRYSISATATGSMWYFGDTQPVSANANDYWLRTDTGHYGEIDQYDGTVWTMVGTFAGRDGQDGQDGQDGITPNIDPTSKHWMIGSTDTGVVAEGQDGATGATGATGADGASISATETATTGGHIVTIHSTDPNVSDVSFTLTNGANGADGTDGDDGASISVTTALIVGGHSVTFHSTDPQVADVTFNVMDGSAGGYSGTNGITVAGNDISVNIGNGLQINSNTGNIDVVGKQSTITTSATLTLTVNDWSNNTQTVTFAHDTSKRNIIDITSTEIETWAQSGVYAYSETSSGITFKCSSVPESALTFKVTSMEVS